MKKTSIVLACVLVALVACTKSKEVHPELGDGNDEIVTVGMKDVHVEYTRTDHAELQKVVFHYSLTEAQRFVAAEMTKRETFFELTLNDLLSDTLYCYYYELFPNGGSAFQSNRKTFHTQAFDAPEPPYPPVVNLPTVFTTEVSEITTNSAQCGGEVTDDGGAEVTERGICWSTNANPTISDSHVSSGLGIGSFTSQMSGLTANITYHVRAYATNSVGTAYGLDKEFTTLSSGSDVPEGAINGLFTINANGDQVYFSQGNLQYQASSNTWKFAEKQWEYIGSGNDNISSTYNGWIDLFGWSTSGWDNGNICYHPWDSNNSANLYGPPGNYDLVDLFANADWGVYNAIMNGGNNTNQWRTLTYPEWEYLFKTRNTFSGIRYAKGNVNDVNGVILLPDDWSGIVFSFSNANSAIAGFDSNIISTSQWFVFENMGAVFLPAAGFYSFENQHVGGIGDFAYYWSVSYSTTFSGCDAYSMCFWDSYLDYGIIPRSSRHSVRVIQDANKK